MAVAILGCTLPMAALVLIFSTEGRCAPREAVTESILQGLSEFSHHELITPHFTTNQQKGLHLEQGLYPENVTVSFAALNQSFVLRLQHNKHLFHSSYIEKYFEDKAAVISQPHTQVLAHCYYHGYVDPDRSTTVALSLCNEEVVGSIMTSVDTYYVEALPTQSGIKHYLVRDSDRIPNNLTCGFHNGLDNLPTEPNLQHMKVKRSLHWPYDTTAATRIVELYVANDFTQYDNYGRDIVRVIKRTKDIVNIVSSLYRPLNIYVALVGIEIWTSGDQIQVEGNADSTMNNFLEYRRDYISPQHKNDNAQLITGSVFTDGVVGKAVKSTICSWQYSGGVNMDHSNLVGPVATTVAHEMGHNFGMQHDDNTCTCPDDRCIMAASSGGKNPTAWSSCSISELGDAFHQGLDYCLQNLPEDLYGEAVCGNGFREDKEECDCGLPQDCDTPCCNPETCRLMENATCATGSCCDTQTCQVKPITTLCRAAAGACDLGEYCDGKSEFCPNDVHKQNGLECLPEEAYCYDGQCRSHQTQCRKLWGPTGSVANSLCFEHFNTMGLANGHCGFNWVDKVFTKCAAQDVMCGMLHCEHRNERLQFWKEALAYTMPEAWVMVNGSKKECKGAVLDVGLNMPDPGMTPDGTRCGHNKMCVKHRCKPLATLDILPCPNCHGHGVCNSLGQCHCDYPYAPPFCDKSGNGGSLHSGPIKVYVDRLVGVIVAFMLILALMCVAAFFMYRYRQKIKKLWNGRPYKYDFLHRAKRSEPPQSLATTPTTRDTPVTPNDPVQRRPSVRDMEIGRPLFQSCTKSPEALENMSSVGGRQIQSRPLPDVPGIPGPRSYQPAVPASFEHVNHVVNLNHQLEQPSGPERPPPPRTLQSPIIPMVPPPPATQRDGYLVPVVSRPGEDSRSPPQRPPTTYLEKVHIAPPPSPPPPPVKPRLPYDKSNSAASQDTPGKYENVAPSIRDLMPSLGSERGGIFKTSASSFPINPPKSLIGPALDGSEKEGIPEPSGISELKKHFETAPSSKSGNTPIKKTAPASSKPAVGGPKKGPSRPPMSRSSSTAGNKPKTDSKARGAAPRRSSSSSGGGGGPAGGAAKTSTAGNKAPGKPAGKPTDTAAAKATPAANKPTRKAPRRPDAATPATRATNKPLANGRPAPVANGKPAGTANGSKPSIDRGRKPSLTKTERPQPPGKPSAVVKPTSRRPPPSANC